MILILLKLIAIPIFLILIYHLSTRRYLNPYKLTMVFGKKGSGKSTLLTKMALKYLKLGYRVYTTESIPGTYLITPEDIGSAEFPPRSVLLIDEAGMKWDNRNFKNFDAKVRDWFKLQRHRKLIVWLFSQTFDVDKKIRDLTDDMYLVEKKFRVFSYAKRILKRTVLVQSKTSAQGESKITEDLVFDYFLLFMFGSRRFTFIPKYVGMFDSFVADPLEDRDFEYIPPLKVPVKKRKFKFPKLRFRR